MFLEHVTFFGAVFEPACSMFSCMDRSHVMSVLSLFLSGSTAMELWRMEISHDKVLADGCFRARFD